MKKCSPWEALDIRPRERAAIIGSGGKTTLMCSLGRCVGVNTLLGTTTHLAAPALEQCGWAVQHGLIQTSQLAGWNGGHCVDYPGIFLPFANVESLRNCWTQLGTPKTVLTARLASDKLGLRALHPSELEQISSWPDLDLLVVEADGSKRLPVKAHASHEPVMYGSCTLGIAVIGLQAWRRQVCEGQVHRPELMQELLSCTAAHHLTKRDLAKCLVGYLQQMAVPRKAVVLSQAEGFSEFSLQKLGVLVEQTVQEELGSIPWTAGGISGCPWHCVVQRQGQLYWM